MKSSRTGRGQLFEAKVEAEDKSSRPRPRTKFWPRGELGLEDLTSVPDILYNYTSCHHQIYTATRTTLATQLDMIA